MTDPTVDIWIPTRGFVYWETVASLNAHGLEYRFMAGGVSISEVRNRIVLAFLHGNADVLLMIDDDVQPPSNVLDLADELMEGEYDAIGGIVLTTEPGSVHLPNVYKQQSGGDYVRALLPTDGEQLHQVDAIGAGCLAVRRDALEGVRNPFGFRLNPDGVIVTGEDIAFCERLRRRGGRIGAHYGVFCEHYDDIHAAGLAQSYMQVVMEAGKHG